MKLPYKPACLCGEPESRHIQLGGVEMNGCLGYWPAPAKTTSFSVTAMTKLSDRIEHGDAIQWVVDEIKVLEGIVEATELYLSAHADWSNNQESTKEAALRATMVDRRHSLNSLVQAHRGQ